MSEGTAKMHLRKDSNAILDMSDFFFEMSHFQAWFPEGCVSKANNIPCMLGVIRDETARRFEQHIVISR
jgi:hypothetical protein